MPVPDKIDELRLKLDNIIRQNQQQRKILKMILRKLDEDQKNSECRIR
jgi:hypothetical protein